MARRACAGLIQRCGEEEQGLERLVGHERHELDDCTGEIREQGQESGVAHCVSGHCVEEETEGGEGVET